MDAKTTPSTDCDIIILTINSLPFLKPCLNSLKKNTRIPVRVFIVNNGSDTETKNYLDSIENTENINFEVIDHPENIGFVRGNNEAAKLGKSKYVCLLNNDTLLTENWLSKLIHTFEEEPNAGVVIPFFNIRRNQVAPENLETYSKELEKNKKGIVKELGIAPAFCLVTKREIIEKYGLFDEEIDTAYFEDADFSFRLREKNYKVLIRHDTFVYHHEHGAQQKNPELKEKLRSVYNKNKEWFIKKWGKNLKVYSLRQVPEKETYSDAIRRLCINQCMVKEVVIGQRNAYHPSGILGLKQSYYSQIFGIAYFIFYSIFKIKKSPDVLITNEEGLVPFLFLVKFFRRIPIVFVTEMLPKKKSHLIDWVIYTGNDKKSGGNILNLQEIIKLRKLLNK